MKKYKKRLLIIISTLIVLCGVFFGGYFVGYYIVVGKSWDACQRALNHQMQRYIHDVEIYTSGFKNKIVELEKQLDKCKNRY